ncbi:unnamed protein product [Hydatigera taeniaeformis]|uniref:TWiK family of potassium channels protein 7 n=1 Tax=Hydatigena taeniaeformis TaxID=6205 RepID=A0A0R3WK42_HYDTA|nr:unnamed protein product [Hydatigera taeniaeformis]
MESILDRTKLGRPKCAPNSESHLKDYSSHRSKIVSASANMDSPNNRSLNTYENLQPPPKPSFNPAANLQLIMTGEQNPAPPKPSLEPPQSEELDSLIYSMLKEFRPAVEQVKSDPPTEEMNHPLYGSTKSKKFTVTPVPSGGSPTGTTFVESFSSRSSNDDGQPKLAAPQESLKYITVPEDLINLDRRSILRARFRKALEYAKHALGFIISHIGLSLMVVGYTILGALVFCAVERERERQVKTQMLVRFNNTLTELMDLWITSYINLRNKIDLIHRAAMMNQTLAIRTQGKHDLEGLDWYLHGLELSKEIIPRHWLEGIVSKNTSKTYQDLKNSTISSSTLQNLHSATAPASFPTDRNGTSYPSSLEFDHKGIMETLFNSSFNTDQISNISVLAESVRANVTQIIATYVNQVVHAIKDEGWNGASNFDDINWTFEGGVLFAITVITTIGKP